MCLFYFSHVSFMKTLTLNGQLFLTHFPFPSTTSLYENVHSGAICIYLQMKNYGLSAENREAENQVTALARLKRSVLVNSTKIIYHPAKRGRGRHAGWDGWKGWDGVRGGRGGGGLEPINRLNVRYPYLVATDIFCAGKPSTLLARMKTPDLLHSLS